jgi:hypothetical protein
MRKPSAVEARLAALNLLREAPPSWQRTKDLQVHLSNKASLLVAKAAQIAGDLGESGLVLDLVQAFDRLMINPTQTDKGCLAKTKIVQALNALECAQDEVYLKGIRHIQLEPAYGGPVDTACELRVASALGLVQMGSSEALTELVNLMADKEVEARIGAVRALAYSEREEASLLLRFKVLTGDREASVISECFAALMKLSPRKSLLFVSHFLDPEYSSLCEPAALAIGESRLSEAYELLKEKWERKPHPQFRRMLLLPIALVRQESALEFLLSVIATNDVETAAAAITALAIYRQDARVRELVRTAIEGSEKVTLQSVFEREFGPNGPMA